MPSSVSDIVKAVTNSREEYQPTLGWDVVVNYSAKEINKLLEASYKNDTTPGHLKRLSVPVTGMNEDGDPYEIKYNFDIAPPLIQFEALGSAPYCSLTFHINGGTVETSKKSWAVTAGVYKIVVSNLSLATMSGAEGDEPIPIESKKPFDFPNDRPGVGVVTLDLKGSVEKMIVKVSSTPGSDPPHVPQIDNHLGDLQQKILEYFVDPERATSIRYHLARVDSTPPPKGSVSLVPKSFRFATYSLESDPDAPTILSIFIRVTKVHHGEEDVLQSAWTSLWAVQYRVPPIPASHTASIIFNYRLLEEALLLPAFDVHGLKYTTDKHTYAIQTGQNQKQPYWRDPTAKAPYSNRYVGEFEVNFGKEPLKLQLEQPERGAAVGTLKWRNDFEFQWGWSDWDGRRTYSGSGAATVTNTLAKSARFSLTDYTLALDASFGSGDWHRDIRVKDKSFWDKLCGGNGNSGVPPTVKDCLPPSPSLSLDFGSLYYFFVTNLLCPTQKVIDIDTNVGLLLPRDFYVVGSIASKRDIVARISAAGRAPAAIHAPEPHEASSIASSTKVGRLWQTLHTKNDLATSVISSVAKNDREGFLDALDEAGLSASSFTFTDDEHKAFMSGYTPSGELELTVWGGYYETDALPSGEVYGLIVVSNKNQVFWGGRNIASDPEEVSYTLAADGTLSFETKAGPVRLSFERNYSLEDGTISSSRFKGTIGDVALSGRLEKLPLMTLLLRIRLIPSVGTHLPLKHIYKTTAPRQS
ncbi:hypothetical protein BKA62DRAFT_423872 [Auriculariales sp. MPI-PUGE-AT-0066]|nr:hypothetical protein BKA62DRAFT_423872 [Auriculariales sp. MPI-PUGE-AT-0066]